MIYYSDKHESITPKTWYLLNGAARQYLGFTYINGGREVSYRFKGTGVNSYASKTAHELDKTTLEGITA